MHDLCPPARQRFFTHALRRSWTLLLVRLQHFDSRPHVEGLEAQFFLAGNALLLFASPSHFLRVPQQSLELWRIDTVAAKRGRDSITDETATLTQGFL